MDKKYSGILCHITCLPTEYGVGDFGPTAYDFIDRLAEARQHFWQILPIGNTDDSGCPYATDSAFGCAEFLISPALLVKDFSLSDELLEAAHFYSEKVEYAVVKKIKRRLLEYAFVQFTADEAYRQFLEKEAEWLPYYARFRALSETRGPHWKTWDEKTPDENEKLLTIFHQFIQYVAFTQLTKLKNYANQKAVRLIGDLPIFVSYNSMDVWKDRSQFLLNKNEEMEFEAGAAPDAFSETGQKWGTPLYDWKKQQSENYQWWNTRLSFLKRYFDVVRIDHFRGFCATWISRVSEPDASRGQWYPGPKADLFKKLSDCPEVLAEDLGYITSDVNELRDQFGFPTMKVFQFMSPDENNPHKLDNYLYNSVAYTGTHDCDTLNGWYEKLSPGLKLWVNNQLGSEHPDHWHMIKTLLSTPARITLIQIQDLLGLDSGSRFNYPGTVASTNWTWKLTSEQYKSLDWKQLGKITAETERCG